MINAFARRILGKKVLDDFPWKTYTKDDYAPQHLDIHKDFTLLLKSNDFGNLMPGVSLLYQNIMALDIDDALEVGAGSGVNLMNLKLIIPNMDFYGIELLESQLTYGFLEFGERFPKDAIVVGNFLDLNDLTNSTYDLVFTNAVVMHLSQKKAILMIKNMIRSSNKYVLMHENLESSHDFVYLLNELKKSLDFNFKISKVESTSGGIILISKNV
jgi:ubiquinone/menaquinone biosynthesis C-methylase UbiE